MPSHTQSENFRASSPRVTSKVHRVSLGLNREVNEDVGLQLFDPRAIRDSCLAHLCRRKAQSKSSLLKEKSGKDRQIRQFQMHPGGQKTYLEIAEVQ